MSFIINFKGSELIWHRPCAGVFAENRTAIAKGRTPKVDDAWIKVFPEDAGLKGERIPMHHIQGSPLTVPLPDTRHLDAHMPGGFRYNPGGPGSALPAYPPKKGTE